VKPKLPLAFPLNVKDAAPRSRVTMQTFVADPGSLEEIARSVQSDRSRPIAYLAECLRRIETAEKNVQGWCSLDRERALVAAQILQQEAQSGFIRGPLHGVPIAIKDVIDVAGLPTRSGSKTRAESAPSTIDAQIVGRLRIAGAVILGKAHTTEFAYFDGPPPTRNPHDITRTPGGSSAGPAAVVASGMVPLSLGTQTAGSVNRPAAYCGIAAFKPSTGAWSSFGVTPLAPSFDTVGVFGYRVRDAVAAARVLMPPFLLGATRSPPFRIGFIEDPILTAASTAVAASIKSAAEKLAGDNVRIERLQSPVPFANIISAHKTVMDYELARCHRALEWDPDVSAGLREAIARGLSIEDATYRDACGELDLTRDRFWAANTQFDALAFPAAPDVAPEGIQTGDPRFIVPFTALGGPIVSIPIAHGAAGLPLGLMLIGAPGMDITVAGIAEHVANAIELPR
jgi:aspartyl-tRNA(Asn)/glutamyl-tRNA(Gln) amidotransferase subunit A